MKLNPNYFCNVTKKHVCMFCGTVLGQLIDGRYKTYGNKAYALFEKQSPGIYRINGCADCLQKLDFNDQNLLDQIHENMVQCQKNLLTALQREPAFVQKTIDQLNQDKPVVGWHAVQLNENEYDALVARYKQAKGLH